MEREIENKLKKLVHDHEFYNRIPFIDCVMNVIKLDIPTDNYIYFLCVKNLLVDVSCTSFTEIVPVYIFTIKRMEFPLKYSEDYIINLVGNIRADQFDKKVVLSREITEMNFSNFVEFIGQVITLYQQTTLISSIQISLPTYKYSISSEGNLSVQFLPKNDLSSSNVPSFNTNIFIVPILSIISEKKSLALIYAHLWNLTIEYILSEKIIINQCEKNNP